MLNQELIENGTLSFAYGLCKEIAQRYPDKAEYQKELAEMAFRMGDKDVAEQAYRAALEFIPDWNGFSRLADILVKDRRYDEAEAVVRDAIAARDDPYRRVWLGIVYDASGKYELAEQHYLEAIAMQPSYEYGHYRLAQLYVKCNRRDEARAQFETVLRLNPGPERVKAVQAALEKLAGPESAAK
jgi:tetratricopeptide (TPR) repeat protein